MSTLLYFLLWAALIALMMRFGCGAHVMGHGHGSNHGEAARAPRWVPPEKDVDPVCGMTVATRDAKSSVHAGAVYFFCSTACREKFEASPDTFPSGAAAKSEEKEHHHA